jgi:carbamoyltransferase
MAVSDIHKAGRLNPKLRIGPRHPRLGRMGFHAARWLGGRLLGAAGFHQLGSDFADARIARVREKLGRGETVYLAGLVPGIKAE